MATAMINWAAWAIESILTLASEKLRKKEKMSLSDLPENVIDDILSRLPTKDAGRTAVLSRSWRHRWRSIPDLDLSAVSDLGVSQALSLHVGPIRLFKVESPAIARWLATLSSSYSGCLHTLDLSSKYYLGELELELGTLARFFPRLAHLRLASGCLSMLPELDSSEFVVLQTLHLEDVCASDNDHDQLQLSRFVPACPLLETLTVRHHNFEGDAYFFCCNLNSVARDYPRLTHLRLANCSISMLPELDSSELAILQTLQLEEIRVSDNGVRHLQLSMFVPACPLLETLTVRPQSNGYFCYSLNSMARDYPRLTHLRLAKSRISMLPELDSSEFATLQTLHLEHVYASPDDDHYRLQLSMFVPACPLLETLTVRHLNFEGEAYFCYNLSSIARDYPCLTHLQLSEFNDFTIPSSSPGLTSLRTLSLVTCIEIDGDLSVLFSVCPLLENLTLKNVDLMGEECLDVVAPNLRFLELVQVGLEDFSITGAPILETAIIDIHVRGTNDESDSSGDGEASGSCNLIKILGGKPCIKRLNLGHGTLMFLGKGHVPEKFPASFDHLRYMSLHAELRDIQVLQVILCLLRSTPNLRELDLKGCCCYREFPVVGKDFWKAQEHLGLFDNLARVKVTNIFGAELDFIQFVLSKARVLMTMMVSISDGPTRKKLLIFPRVSKQAKIIFT